MVSELSCFLSLLLKDDSNSDVEERPPLKVNRPLAATFSDTELQRPNSTRLSRKQTLREDRPEVKGSRMDPIKAIVLAHHKTKRTLMLGKTPLSEDTFNTSKGDLDKFLKREREHTTEPEESFKGSKKAKIENVKSERDNELYTNEHTVRPENVLMMVDSSLVDTPERRRYNEQNNNHSQEATAITGRISGIGYKREHEYENVYDQEYDQENSQNGQLQDNKIADYNVEARPPGYLRARGKGYGSQEEEDGSQRQPRASHGIWRGKQDEKSLRYY